MKNMKSLMEILKEASSRPIMVLDGTGYSAEVIAELINSKYLSICKSGEPGRDLYYCGIATNIYENRSRHESELGHEIEYVSVYECKDAQVAGTVEQIMKNKGFDIGKTDTFANGGTDDSVLVYLFKK